MKAKLFLAASLFAVVANAQLTSINEDFSGFTQQNFPQNGWTSNRTYPYAYFIQGQYAQSYSLFDVANPTYIITPELAILNGSQTLKFDAQVSTGSGGAGTIQVGTLANPTDVSTFVAISPAVTLTTSAATLTYSVPASSAKYIAFKFQPSTVHAALQVDNVVFGESLSASNFAAAKPVQFVVKNNQINFLNDAKISNVKIYSASGNLVANEAPTQNKLDVSRLSNGVYIIAIENNEGKITKSKFIK